MTQPICTREPEDVGLRLATLGLSQEDLRRAIVEGQMARDSCTANDPTGTPGYLAWSRTVRTLREVLGQRGWRADNTGTFATAVDESGATAIAVMSGDDDTGNATGTPSTKYSKGPRTHAAVDGNTLWLFEEFDSPRTVDSETAERHGRQTWVLLINRRADLVTSELALPEAIGEDGRIDAWAERLLLEPIDLSSPDLDGHTGSGLPELDVPVRRRRG